MTPIDAMKAVAMRISQSRGNQMAATATATSPTTNQTRCVIDGSMAESDSYRVKSEGLPLIPARPRRFRRDRTA